MTCDFYVVPVSVTAINLSPVLSYFRIYTSLELHGYELLEFMGDCVEYKKRVYRLELSKPSHKFNAELPWWDADETKDKYKYVFYLSAYLLNLGDL